MNDINDSAKNIFNMLINKNNTSGDFQESILEFICAYELHENNSSREQSNINLINVKDMYDTLIIIKNILHINFQIWTSDKINQTMNTINFAHILSKINEEDIHKITVDEKEHSCGMHNESLTTHLLSTMFVVHQRITTLEKPMEHMQKIAYCLLALLHDIGKYSTVGTTYGNKNWTQYPFHGEMGAGLLLQSWTIDGIGRYFTKEIWEDIARTISVHMCGYREVDINDSHTLYKWNMLSNEKENVKDMLYYLSIGDKFGGYRPIEERFTEEN
jgi:hypothetical protein